MHDPLEWDALQHYWPRYCEENVWHLCGTLPDRIARAHAVILSNPGRSLAMWSQSACGSDGQPVVWDYHVVLLGQMDGGWSIWDADSTLSSPQPAERYLDTSFRVLPPEHARLRPLFRVVEAEVYRRTLCTDRSHMRAPGGGWLASPPPGPGIGTGTNLIRFIDMESEFVGRVLDLPSFRAWIAGAPD